MIIPRVEIFLHTATENTMDGPTHQVRYGWLSVRPSIWAAGGSSVGDVLFSRGPRGEALGLLS